MTQIPARILRAQAEDLHPSLKTLTPPQQERHMLILECAQMLFAKHGRQTISFTALAAALTISTGALRRHFCDLDALLGEILHRHIQAIAAALAEIPQTAPNRPRALRAAYFAATRNTDGTLTQAHAILVSQRNLLPPDLLEPLEQARNTLGAAMAGPLATQALGLLDQPWATLQAIETMLATVAAPQPQQAKPAGHPSRPHPADVASALPPLPPRQSKPRLDRHPDDVFILEAGVTLDNKPQGAPAWQRPGQSPRRGPPPQAAAPGR